MLASELITQAVLPLRTSDTGELALDRMDELKVTHLPIVNNLEFLGLISESDILGLNDPHAPVGLHRLSEGRLYVEEGQHIYEVLKLVYEYRLSIVPVLNHNKHYLGVITREDLVRFVCTLTATDQPGAVIVIEIPAINYSASEIIQIIESNGGRTLSLFTRTIEGTSNLEVTIKLDQLDISTILQAFNRYSYNIKVSFSESRYYDDLMENYHGLMNYLNI